MGSHDSHLYGQDGKFLFRGKVLGICALDKAKDYVYDVGALGPSFRFCRRCITKNGAANLRHDSNVALAKTKVAHDKASEEMKEMEKRYKEKFGRGIRWQLPIVKRT